MTDRELREAFEAAEPYLEAWGTHVTQVIAEHFRDTLSAVGSAFFAVEPRPRVKKINEFIAKARREGKNYADPWQEITDKVGTRFVTLLASDAQKVCRFIQQHDGWTARADRLHESFKRKKPTEFLYASDHYIVQPQVEISLGSVKVPVEAACEVQVRTLLQHGYSELTHNTVYKGALANDPDAVRKAARSMALIETTDDIFEMVAQTSLNVVKPLEDLHTLLEGIWREQGELGEIRADSLSRWLLGELSPNLRLTPDLGQRISEFYKAQPERAAALADARGEIFKLPVALLLVFLAVNQPRTLEGQAVISYDELEELDALTGAGLQLP